MKYFLGADLSLTGTGLCLIEQSHEIAEHITVDPKGRRGCERLEFIHDWVKTVLNRFDGIHAVAIEGYAYGARGHLPQLGELGGIIRLELFKRHIPFIEVAPPTLKKYISGSGRGDKNMMLLSVFKKWGISCKDDDQADSYALARLCCALHENEKLLSYEREIIEKIKKNLPSNMTFV